VEVFEKLLIAFPNNNEKILKYLVQYIEDSFDENVTLAILEVFSEHFQKCQ